MVILLPSSQSKSVDHAGIGDRRLVGFLVRRFRLDRLGGGFGLGLRLGGLS
jgi:hypothetical protein